MSQEFQEEAKRLGLTGNQLTQKYINENKMPDPTIVNRNNGQEFLKRNKYKDNTEYRNKCAQKLGYNGHSERYRERNTDLQRISDGCTPISEDKSLNQYIGEHIGENVGNMILSEIFGGIEEKMLHDNPGYDCIVKGRYKVDIKTDVLRRDGYNSWEYYINQNNVAHCFLLLAFDNIDILNLLHAWLIYGNDMVRKGTSKGGYKLERLCMRKSISIVNGSESSMSFKHFKKYDYIDRLKCKDKIKEYCDNNKAE